MANQNQPRLRLVVEITLDSERTMCESQLRQAIVQAERGLFANPPAPGMPENESSRRLLWASALHRLGSLLQHRYASLIRNSAHLSADQELINVDLELSERIQIFEEIPDV